MLIMSGSMLFSNIVLWSFLHRYIDFKQPDWKRAGKHVPKLLLLFVPVIAVSVYQKMDKVMLGSFSVIEQSGYYESVEKIINIPKGVITALGTVMLPRMSYLMAKGEDRTMKTYISNSMEFVLFSSSALAFGIAAVADDFVPFFFGPNFTSISPLIRLMSANIIMVACANVIRTQYLIPGSRDQVYLVSVWVGAIVNFLINFCLIPQYGALGAVIGTVAAEFCVMVYQMLCVRSELDIAGYLKSGMYYIFCGLVMYCGIHVMSVVLCFRMERLWLILCEIVVGTAIYLLTSMPYIVFSRNSNLTEMIKTQRRQK